MKKLFISALLASTFSFSALAADEYAIDPYHATVMIKAQHLGFSTVYMRADEVQGKLQLDEDEPENSKVEITIPTQSINGFVPNFSAHLHSKDFFAADEYPAITFTSHKVERTGDTTALIHGDLTIKNITRPIVLEMKLNKIGSNPFSKEEYRAGFSGRTVLKRSDFNINYALPHVADEVEVQLEIEWLRQ